MRVCECVPMCVGEHSAAVRGSDLKQAIACCENIIASVYYCFSVKQWECCVCCTGWWSVCGGMVVVEVVVVVLVEVVVGGVLSLLLL